MMLMPWLPTPINWLIPCIVILNNLPDYTIAFWTAVYPRNKCFKALHNDNDLIAYSVVAMSNQCPLLKEITCPSHDNKDYICIANIPEMYKNSFPAVAILIGYTPKGPFSQKAKKHAKNLHCNVGHILKQQNYNQKLYSQKTHNLAKKSHNHR